MRDNQHRKSDPTIGGNNDPQLDGEIAAGDQLRGVVTFEVPKESHDTLRILESVGCLVADRQVRSGGRSIVACAVSTVICLALTKCILPVADAYGSIVGSIRFAARFAAGVLVVASVLLDLRITARRAVAVANR